MLMLAMTLALTSTANMAKADDFYDGLVAYQSGDYATAFKLVKPFADQGNSDAQFALGWMLHNGEVVLQDYKEAVRWFRKAADQGHTKAQFALGLMYRLGEGVLQDNKKAHMWWNIARANGEKEYAADNINIITRYMTPADISKAQDMAKRCLASNYQDC